MFQDRVTGRRVAIKEITYEAKEDFKGILEEIEALRTLSQCENIIGLEQVYVEEGQVFLVMQYAPHGSLFDLIMETEFTEKDIKKIITQLLLALNFMHANQFLHRDIKPVNILVLDREKLRVSIADLGLTHNKEQKDVRNTRGTPGYIAPESLWQEPISSNSDIFSLGIVFFNILTGQNFYEGANEKEIMSRNKFSNPISILNSADFSQFSEECLDLLRQMLHPNPAERFDSEKCLNHKWFKKART